MPIDYTRYPTNWQALRVAILARAGLQCECTGQCGLHHGHRCTECHHKPAVFARGRIVLTLAHLLHRDPPCDHIEHILAMCQRCHLRLDRFHHAQARLRTQRRTGTSPAAHLQRPPATH